MGLAVVHGIVENHAGAITVESEVGVGTTFSVLLPFYRKKVDNPAQLYDGPVSGKGTILFVDDEEIVVEMNRQLLSRLGYNVLASHTCHDALDLFKEHADEIDLVITDQTMPKMTGMELAAKIIALKPDMPVILCSGYSDLITQEKLEEIGIRRYLKKPLSIRDMALAINAVLNKQQ